MAICRLTNAGGKKIDETFSVTATHYLFSTTLTSVRVTPGACFSQSIFLLSFLIFALEFVHKACLDHTGHQKALCCPHWSTLASTMVWCL